MKPVLSRADVVVIAFCLALISSIALLVGCGEKKPAFQARPAEAPAWVYCFDTTGHKSGAKPFILGGTCCCTPSEALLATYHAEDTVPTTVNLQHLVEMYNEANIRTALDHQACNNLCQWGPHVVKGGHCMAPPTPATFNYEEIRFGAKYVPTEPTGKKK